MKQQPPGEDEDVTATLQLVSSQSAEQASHYRTHPSSAFAHRDPHCAKCNYDAHVCNGCGANVTHEQDCVCLKCRNVYGVS